MSCNGCRALRKGCTEDCTLRPCLQWIKSPNSQANATLFLAKFYGRAGLINLINAGPQHFRPAIFRSLLYDACGRIINPIYGSLGLLWSGNWHHCKLAVDAVLQGSRIMPLPIEDATAASHPVTPINVSDMRHIAKESGELHRTRTRNRFKRSGDRGKDQVDPVRFSISGWDGNVMGRLNGAPRIDSSMFSVEKMKNRTETGRAVKSENHGEESEVGLELTLGFNPVLRTNLSMLDSNVINVPDSD
ncbi:LOB domain-containing protein 40-like [Cornus florida]|uniref:LOB domain-containing protein 40-like n=1 Tax=Cornus florida TaxID=4283 RepID=UPI0028A00325|nr:LOB domain-containing protein 40-like [Cornus florida]